MCFYLRIGVTYSTRAYTKVCLLSQVVTLFLILIHALLIYIYNNMDTIIKMMYRTILEGTGNFVHNLAKGE